MQGFVAVASIIASRIGIRIAHLDGCAIIKVMGRINIYLIAALICSIVALLPFAILFFGFFHLGIVPTQGIENILTTLTVVLPVALLAAIILGVVGFVEAIRSRELMNSPATMLALLILLVLVVLTLVSIFYFFAAGSALS